MTREEIQNEACEKFIIKKKGILAIAPRVGKTFTGIKILNKLFDYSPTILICYPDNKIRTSWENDFIKWGYDKTENITFCNYASIDKYSDKLFDIVFLDEIHDTSEYQRTHIEELVKNNDIICGLSGSISTDTEQELKGLGLSVIYKYTTDQAVKDNIVSDYQIRVFLVDLDNKVKTPNKKGKLLTEKQKYDNYTYVINQMKQDGRNFMHLALTRNRLALSSLGKINYLKTIIATSRDRFVVFCGLTEVADSLGIPSYHTKSPNDQNFKDFIDGKIDHLALVNIGKAGITFPNLDRVIISNFSYNKEESLQVVNRCMNLDYDGKLAFIDLICLNEPAEIKKVKESLSMLDPKKIKYV